MAVYNSTITPTTTGVKTVTVPFTPAGYEVIVSAKTSDAYAHQSTGFVDSTGYTTCHAFVESTSTTTGATLKNVNNGVIVQVLEPSGTSYGVANGATHDSFTSNSVKFNVTNVSATYQYNVRIWS